MDSLEKRLKPDFPNLHSSNHKITSPQTPDYNCIAWAAGDDERWWWPGSFPHVYWPPGIPLNESIDSFVAAFSTLDYMVCDSSDLELDYEKVALFADKNGKPTHMARQLASGVWTSKLGQDHDIEHHELDVICGPAYGDAVKIFRRVKNN